MPSQKKKAEHGIVSPSNLVHISTLPLKLYDKNKNLKTEAISATSSVPQLRPAKKESSAAPKEFQFKFKEGNNSPFKNHTFQTILIREGMGNFRDRFFYTKEALKRAVESKLFEGVQCYADHPTEIQEQIQPERSTRDILGYYQNVTFEEGDDGAGRLIADLCVGNSISLDWAMSLLTNSIDYSSKFRETDLVGLSINASGSANPVGIDEFISQNTLSQSVLAKLNEAKAQGITEINLVQELTEAQSVDLVTKAGAGGKILRMLEMEKTMAKKKFFEAEMEKEKEKHCEDGAKDASAMAPGDSKAKPDHADEEQDKELFAKMIKQYLGKDDADEEEMEMAKHAYDAHKEGGMEHEAAMEAAGQHLKMAMAIGKKMSDKGEKPCDEAGMEKEAEEADDKKEKPMPMEDEAAEKHHEKGMPAGIMKKKESQVVQLSGEVARLRESLQKIEIKEHLEKKMKESGRSNTFTKIFRESIGTPKSKQHVDDMWKIFLKAADAGVEEVGVESESFLTEKSTYRESSAAAGRVDMSACLR